MPTPPDEIILRDGYFIRRSFTETRILSQEEALRYAVGTQATNLYNIVMMGSNPIHGLFSTTYSLLYSRVNELPFHTFYDLADNLDDDLAWYYPVFRANQGQFTTEIKASFKIPAHTPTYFAELFVNSQGRHSLSNCYLLTMIGGEMYNFPYPNIFDDGRICMGREWDNHKNGTITTQPLIAEFASSFMTFNTTAMNDHLVKDATYDLFTYNVKTNKFKANDMTIDQIKPKLRICGNATFANMKIPDEPVTT